MRVQIYNFLIGNKVIIYETYHKLDYGWLNRVILILCFQDILCILAKNVLHMYYSNCDHNYLKNLSINSYEGTQLKLFQIHEKLSFNTKKNFGK